MSISIYSVLFSVLISGILLFSMIFFCKQCENMGKTELITAIMIGMLCFCRILFPVDLRSSYAIKFKGLYADLCSTMMKNVMFLGRKYEVWHGIALSIGVVAFIKKADIFMESWDIMVLERLSFLNVFAVFITAPREVLKLMER